MMKILIDDGMQIKVGTGIGTYSLDLFNLLDKVLGKEDVAVSDFDKIKKSRVLSRLHYLLYINSKKYIKKCEEYDVVHFTNFAIPFRRSKKVKYAVTIHDMAAFLYPESLSFAYRLYNRFCIKYSIKKADIVTTVSNSVKMEIEKLFPKAKNIIVLPNGIELNKHSNNINLALTQKYLIDKKKIFLFVGTVEKRKNLSILIEAFIKLKEKYDLGSYKLVLAGRPGIGYDDYKKLIDNSCCSKDIITTGFISNEEREWLYENAAAYVFPSVYEGFGIPQLECMAHHLPLICSDIPTNREISGDYGLFFDLNDTESLVKQMKKIVDGEYDYEVRAKVADAVVERFKWDNVVHEFIKAYEDIVNEQR